MIGARRDEGAERGSVTEEQRRLGPKMGLPAGPDAFGLRRRRSSLPYSRYARSSLLGSLQIVSANCPGYFVMDPTRTENSVLA